MARPNGSYRFARRNEARNARKQARRNGSGGKRVSPISYLEVQRINRMHKASAR